MVLSALCLVAGYTDIVAQIVAMLFMKLLVAGTTCGVALGPLPCRYSLLACQPVSNSF
jgi:hypothetical protein